MGWTYPNMSLEDVMNLVKGFVDILILASGYQSSGRLAHWDSQTVKKALQWGLFFENLLGELNSSNDYRDSVKEFDIALSEMTSTPNFPQGLTHLSSVSLCRGRELVIMKLIHTLPLHNPHLRTTLEGLLQMELDNYQVPGIDGLKIHLKNLMLQSTPTELCQDKGGPIKHSIVSSPGIGQRKAENWIAGEDLTKYTIHELLRRQSAILCLSSAEKGVDVLLKSVEQSKWFDYYDSTIREQLQQLTAAQSYKHHVDCASWNIWRSKSLSYFLDKRTIRLVSGASMIFSVPKLQWLQLFERLRDSKKNDDTSLETIELLLLGSISSRWHLLLDHLISVSYNPIAISEQYAEICSLFIGRPHALPATEKSTMEVSILEYATELLGNQIYMLQKLPPVLAAIAVPSWSSLFRLYLSEIEHQLNGNAPEKRQTCRENLVPLRFPCQWPAYAKTAIRSRLIHKAKISEEMRVKLLNNLRSKRIRFSSWGTKIASSGTTTMLLQVERRAEAEGHDGPYFLKQLVWKFKSQWKQKVLKWQTNRIRYGYDLQSYAQNFDDGFLHESFCRPCAPH